MFLKLPHKHCHSTFPVLNHVDVGVPVGSAGVPLLLNYSS